MNKSISLVILPSMFWAGQVLANDITAIGARAAAMGGTLMSANDTFALGVNPSRLVTNTSESVREVALTLSRFHDAPYLLDNTTSNIGGFYGGENWVFGMILQSAPNYSPDKAPEGVPNYEFAESEFILGVGWGDTLGESEAFNYGLGWSYSHQKSGLYNVDYVDGSTLSARMGGTTQFSFTESAIALDVNVGVSAAEELLLAHPQGTLTLRPQTIRLGIDTSLHFVTEESMYQFGFSVEQVDMEATHLLLRPDVLLGSETRAGVEFVYQNLDGGDGYALALRAGIRQPQNELAESALSVGLGYALGKAAIDLSAVDYGDARGQVFDVTLSLTFF